jgi:hypothetical protein
MTLQEKGTLNLPQHYNKNMYEVIDSFMGNRLIQWFPSHIHELMAPGNNVYVYFGDVKLEFIGCSRRHILSGNEDHTKKGGEVGSECSYKPKVNLAKTCV